MKLTKDIQIGSILLVILILTRYHYEDYRLFLIYVPTYICILYLNLRKYYHDFSLIRFSNHKKWISNNLLLIFEHCIISAMVLGLDKNFIVGASDVQIVLLFIEYVLFFFLLSGILIFPNLSIIKSIISSIAILILIKTKTFNFDILDPLYDARRFNIDGGILTSIIFLLFLNLILYTLYFLFINRKVRCYGYEALKKNSDNYFNSNNNINI